VPADNKGANYADIDTRACLKPGVCMARMALQCGINANLLLRWITQSVGVDMKTARANMPSLAIGGSDAFVPLRLAPPAAVPVGTAALKVRLHTQVKVLGWERR
jgi:transposase